MKQPVDFIIIGSGIAGLYAAYQIKRISQPPPTRRLTKFNICVVYHRVYHRPNHCH